MDQTILQLAMKYKSTTSDSIKQAESIDVELRALFTTSSASANTVHGLFSQHDIYYCNIDQMFTNKASILSLTKCFAFHTIQE